MRTALLLMILISLAGLYPADPEPIFLPDLTFVEGYWTDSGNLYNAKISISNYIEANIPVILYFPESCIS